LELSEKKIKNQQEKKCQKYDLFFVNKINNLATQSWKNILAFASEKIKKN
jgi:hypothetical protein